MFSAPITISYISRPDPIVFDPIVFVEEGIDSIS
jgi:hypothetical protein